MVNAGSRCETGAPNVCPALSWDNALGRLILTGEKIVSLDREQCGYYGGGEREGSPMNKDDMILISVDDHIVEPPDMFKNHLPKKYLDDAPRLVHNPDGSDTWQFRDVVIPNVALERGGRAAEGGVRPGAAGPRRDPAGLLQRRRARQGHERRRHPRARCASRRSPASRAGCSPPRTPSSRWRWCRPTTTGTSRSGAARTRRASSR